MITTLQNLIGTGGGKSSDQTSTSEVIRLVQENSELKTVISDLRAQIDT